MTNLTNSSTALKSKFQNLMLERNGSLKSVLYEIEHHLNYTIFITLGCIRVYFAFFINRSLKNVRLSKQNRFIFSLAKINHTLANSSEDATRQRNCMGMKTTYYQNLFVLRRRSKKNLHIILYVYLLAHHKN